MKFHNHETAYEQYRPNVGVAEYYEAMKGWIPRDGEDVVMLHQLHIEAAWYSLLRPYYKVWPAIQRSLFSVRLDCTLESLGLQQGVIAIRFCNGEEPRFDEVAIKYILVAYGVALQYEGCDEVFPFHVLMRLERGGNETIRTFSMAHQSHTTLEDAVLSSKCRAVYSETNTGDAIKVAGLKCALTTLLLRNDPDFVKPEVLVRDQDKFERTGDPRYIEKAKRYGIVGWRIGEAFESIPHYRRPHLGLRHTGPGRTVPKIVPIKGAIVHRQKMTRVPTGYITPDGVEVEP